MDLGEIGFCFVYDTDPAQDTDTFECENEPSGCIKPEKQMFGYTIGG
jgi:hypothetical protein